MDNFGIRVAEARRALHMTQAHLAGAAEVSLSTVQRAERGVPVSAESVRALCATLSLDLPVPAMGHIPDTRSAIAPVRLPSARLTCLCIATLTVMPVETWIHWNPLGGDLASWLGLSRLWAETMYIAGAYVSAVLACTLTAMLVANHRSERTAGARLSRVRTCLGALAGMAVVPVLLFAYVYGVMPLSAGYGPHGSAFEVQDIVPAWEIPAGSPMMAAGMRIGDRIVAVDGRPVETGLDLTHARYRLTPGQHVPFVVERPEREPSGTVVTTASYPLVPTRAVELDVVVAANGAGWTLLGSGHLGDIGGVLSSTMRPATLAEKVDLIVGAARSAVDLASHPLTLGRERIWDDLNLLVSYDMLTEWTGPVTSAAALGSLALCVWLSMRGRDRGPLDRGLAMARSAWTRVSRWKRDPHDGAPSRAAVNRTAAARIPIIPSCGAAMLPSNG